MSANAYDRQVSLDLDISQITNLVQAMPEFEKEIIDAAKPALKRVAEHLISKSGQIVSKYYHIKSGDVKKTLSIVNNQAGFAWAVKSTGRRQVFTKFPFQPGSWMAYKKVMPRPTVYVKIKREGGFKPLHSKKLGVFMIPLSKKPGVGIFKREGKERQPIRPWVTMAVPQMITSLYVAQKISASANEMLTNRLDHEILRRFRNLGKQVAK